MRPHYAQFVIDVKGKCLGLDCENACQSPDLLRRGVKVNRRDLPRQTCERNHRLNRRSHVNLVVVVLGRAKGAEHFKAHVLNEMDRLVETAARGKNPDADLLVRYVRSNALSDNYHPYEPPLELADKIFGHA